jgi:hypothetical protein
MQGTHVVDDALVELAATVICAEALLIIFRYSPSSQVSQRQQWTSTLPASLLVPLEGLSINISSTHAAAVRQQCTAAAWMSQTFEIRSKIKHSNPMQPNLE